MMCNLVADVLEEPVVPRVPVTSPQPPPVLRLLRSVLMSPMRSFGSGSAHQTCLLRARFWSPVPLISGSSMNCKITGIGRSGMPFSVVVRPPRYRSVVRPFAILMVVFVVGRAAGLKKIPRASSSPRGPLLALPNLRRRRLVPAALLPRPLQRRLELLHPCPKTSALVVDRPILRLRRLVAASPKATRAAPSKFESQRAARGGPSSSALSAFCAVTVSFASSLKAAGVASFHNSRLLESQVFCRSAR